MTNESEGQAERSIGGVRLFRIYESTADDLDRVRSLGPNDCPRRYCWWWHSLEFDWALPVQSGCTFVKAWKPPNWSDPQTPCRRCDSDSDIDHFEPREPHLIEDGVNEIQFTGIPVAAIQDQIRHVLIHEWHPTRPNRAQVDLAWYDLLIGALYTFMIHKSPPAELGNWLMTWDIQDNAMLWEDDAPPPPPHMLAIAKMLLAIDISS
jgi:hypothetical protein